MGSFVICPCVAPDMGIDSWLVVSVKVVGEAVMSAPKLVALVSMKRKLVVLAGSAEDLDSALSVDAAMLSEEVAELDADGIAPSPRPGTVTACHQIDSSFLCLFGLDSASASFR